MQKSKLSLPFSKPLCGPRRLRDKALTSHWGLHGQALGTSLTTADAAPLSNLKAVPNSHLLSELQVWMSHGLLDTSPKMSQIPLYPLCPLSISLKCTPPSSPHFEDSCPTYPSGLSLCASSFREPDLTPRETYLGLTLGPP